MRVSGTTGEAPEIGHDEVHSHPHGWRRWLYATNMYNEWRGKFHFWNSLIWVNVTFFPMHFLGLAGMPRRYAAYSMQFADFHAITSVGALLFGLSQAYFLFAVVLPTIKAGAKAEDKPWDGAEGLEWTVPSPAPFHTFEVQPIIK